MKKMFLVVSIMLASFSVTFGQKCKPAVSTVDEFTEQEIVAWGGKLGSSRNLLQGVSQNLKIYVYGSNGVNYVEIDVQYMQKGYDASVNTFDIPKGSEFKLKTNDGILNFTSIKIKKAKRKISRYIVTAISVIAKITNEQLEKLSNSPILMYRIEPLEGEAIKGKVKKGKAKKLQAQFTCFKKENHN